MLMFHRYETTLGLQETRYKDRSYLLHNEGLMFELEDELVGGCFLRKRNRASKRKL